MEDWVAASKAGLLAGEVQVLPAERAEITPEAETWATEVTYRRNQAHRMTYHQYQVAGYPLGSGAVENANCHVVGVRIKQAGMSGAIRLRLRIDANRNRARVPPVPDTHSGDDGQIASG